MKIQRLAFEEGEHADKKKLREHDWSTEGYNDSGHNGEQLINSIREQEDALYRRSIGLIGSKAMSRKREPGERIGPGRKLKKMKFERLGANWGSKEVGREQGLNCLRGSLSVQLELPNRFQSDRSTVNASRSPSKIS